MKSIGAGTIHDLPGAVLEELAALQREPDPRAGWASGDRSTAFLRTMADVKANPEWSGDESDDDFRIMVPFSGGMDSTTCVEMARRGAYPVVPVYIDTGAPYAAEERRVCRDLYPETIVIELADAIRYVRYGPVDLGRNAIIVWTLAGLMRERGIWGELWFGNSAVWGETPVVGGDKSMRWGQWLQHLLTLAGFAVRLQHPLIGLTKADLVVWWEQRGMLDTFVRRTRSCFDPAHATGCGRCQPCFHKMIALHMSGHAALAHELFPDPDWSNPLQDYWRFRQLGGTTMSTTRCAAVDACLEQLGLCERGPA